MFRWYSFFSFLVSSKKPLGDGKLRFLPAQNVWENHENSGIGRDLFCVAKGLQKIVTFKERKKERNYYLFYPTLWKTRQTYLLKKQKRGEESVVKKRAIKKCTLWNRAKIISWPLVLTTFSWWPHWDQRIFSFVTRVIFIIFPDWLTFMAFNTLSGLSNDIRSRPNIEEMTSCTQEKRSIVTFEETRTLDRSRSTKREWKTSKVFRRGKGFKLEKSSMLGILFHTHIDAYWVIHSWSRFKILKVATEKIA